MAIIKCPECGKNLSDIANSCPNCGCPMEEIIKRKEDQLTRMYNEEVGPILKMPVELKIDEGNRIFKSFYDKACSNFLKSISKSDMASDPKFQSFGFNIILDISIRFLYLAITLGNGVTNKDSLSSFVNSYVGEGGSLCDMAKMMLLVCSIDGKIEFSSWKNIQITTGRIL